MTSVESSGLGNPTKTRNELRPHRTRRGHLSAQFLAPSVGAAALIQDIAMKANRRTNGSITLMIGSRPTKLPRRLVNRAVATARQRKISLSDLISSAMARERAGELKIDLAGGAA